MIELLSYLIRIAFAVVGLLIVGRWIIKRI
jgi:hypothetical protein